MTLHCDKTGRHWPCDSFSQAVRMAPNLGLTDWTWRQGDTTPSTMRETIAEMRARPRHRITAGIE